nr:hypothetical protein [Cytobacillus eiseniae]
MLTKLIKTFTKYPLNHASISFSRELDTVYSFGRKRENNPFIGGFVKESLEGELFQKANCAIYSCSVTKFEYEQMLLAIRQIENRQHSYKYNFLGLFGVLFNKRIDREHAFFCSEFVATILNNGGISIMSKHPSLVKPNDLASCKKFDLLYEGSLQSYLAEQGYLRKGKPVKRRNQIFTIGSMFLEKAKSLAG